MCWLHIYVALETRMRAYVCVCVCPSTWRGICVCVCWQAGSEKRSGGACVAAALAQHRSLATAGSAHLKHVQAVFPGPPTRPPSLREGVNRPVCMKSRFEYLLKKKKGGGGYVCVCLCFSICVCVLERERDGFFVDDSPCAKPTLSTCSSTNTASIMNPDVHVAG